MLTKTDYDDPFSCAAAALGLARSVADLLRTKLATALPGRPSSGFGVIARKADSGDIFDRFFRDSLAGVIADADRCIAENTVEYVESFPAWDGEGRETTEDVVMKKLLPAAQDLWAVTRSLRDLIDLIDRVRDLRTAARIIADLH